MAFTLTRESPSEWRVAGFDFAGRAVSGKLVHSYAGYAFYGKLAGELVVQSHLREPSATRERFDSDELLQSAICAALAFHEHEEALA